MKKIIADLVILINSELSDYRIEVERTDGVYGIEIFDEDGNSLTGEWIGTSIKTKAYLEGMLCVIRKLT